MDSTSEILSNATVESGIDTRSLTDKLRADVRSFLARVGLARAIDVCSERLSSENDTFDRTCCTSISAAETHLLSVLEAAKRHRRGKILSFFQTTKAKNE